MTREEFITKYERHRGLSVSWITGGMCGGSCWGDNADEEVGADLEPELELLAEILSAETPSLTIVEFQRIVKDPHLVTTRTWTDYEYYGNHYDMESKTLDLDALWPYIELVNDIPDPEVRASHFALMKD